MSSRETGGALAHRGVITEFMSEMDGLRSGSQEKRVMVIGATNRPFDLDDAVLRRLPRRLLVDLPGEKERREILKILLRGESVAEDVNLDGIAKRTGNFSGSDLKRAPSSFLKITSNQTEPLIDLCVAAALDAVKAGVRLPWRTTETSNNDTPVINSSAGKNLAHVLAIDAVGASGKSPIMVDSVSESTDEPPSPSFSSSAGTNPTFSESDTTPKQPCRVISLSNFEQALKEITPSSSESLGTLSELRKWNDEFGEGKREKRRSMWGRGSFGFVEKGEWFDEIKVAASSGSGEGEKLSP